MGEVWNLDFADFGNQRLPTLQTTKSMAMPGLCRHAADVNKFVVLIQAITILYLSHLPDTFLFLDLTKPAFASPADDDLVELGLAYLDLPVTEDVQVAVLEGLFVDFLAVLILNGHLHLVLISDEVVRTR